MFKPERIVEKECALIFEASIIWTAAVKAWQTQSYLVTCCQIHLRYKLELHIEVDAGTQRNEGQRGRVSH